MDLDYNCIICKESTKENLIKVTERGLGGLLQFSKIRNEDSLHEELRLAKSNHTAVFVHEICRKHFNNKRRIAVQETSGKKTRKSMETFGWKLNCFYCGLPCIYDTKNPKRKNWHLVTTIDIRQRILDICTSKLEDEADHCLTLQIQARILSCIDLVAAEARYHQSCSLRFQTQNESAQSSQKGRRRNENMADVFQQACGWMEASAEILTLTQFRDKMREPMTDEDVYDKRYLKKLLKDKYGPHIFFSEQKGVDYQQEIQRKRK